MSNLLGVDLPEPRRVIRTIGMGSIKRGIARNLLRRGAHSDNWERRKRELVRVLVDGTSGWETWHRSYWELDTAAVQSPGKDHPSTDSSQGGQS